MMESTACGDRSTAFDRIRRKLECTMQIKKIEQYNRVIESATNEFVKEKLDLYEDAY